MISFKSKITQKILNYYFLNPRARHYINEMARLFKFDPKNVDTKLKELEREGIMRSEFSGQQRYFSLAKNSPLVKTYRGIFMRTAGLEERLRKQLKNIVGLQAVYIYGSYAKNTMDSGSDIDILAIGEHSALSVQKAISGIQKESGREINVMHMTPKELQEKKKRRNPFIANIFSGKVIKLI